MNFKNIFIPILFLLATVQSCKNAPSYLHLYPNNSTAYQTLFQIGGYSKNTKGFLNPTSFINSNRP